MAEDDIRIRAELEGHLTRDVREAEDAVDDLGDQAEQTAVQLAIMEAAAAGASREIRKLDRDSRSAERRLADLNAAFGADDQKKFHKDTEKSTTVLGRFNRLLDKFQGKKFDFAKVLNLYKIPAIIAGVTLLSTAVSALGAAGFAGIAGLSPLVGLMAAIPGVVVGAGTAFAGVKLGVSGLGDALKALMDPKNDPEKIAAAMDVLTARGQVLALTVSKLAKGPLQDLKDASQDALSPGLTKAIRASLPLWPILERRVAGAAGMVGRLADDAARTLASPFFSGQLNNVMRSSTHALDLGARGAGHFALAMLGIAYAFRPVLVDMAKYVNAAGKYIEASVQAGNETGRLTAFFQRAWSLAKDFGAVLRDVSVALYNTGKQSSDMSAMMGHGIKDAAAQWRAWTETVQGQSAIRAWFQDSIPVLRAVVGLIADLTRSFAGLADNADLAPVIQQMRDQLGPALSGLSQSFSADFAPAVITAFAAFLKFVNLLSSSPLISILQSVATALNSIADVLNALPGPLKFAIASVLALSFALRTMGIGMAVARKGLAPLTGALSQVATGAQAGMIRTQGLARVTGGLQGAFMGAKMAGAGLFGALGGPWGIAIAAATIGLGIWIQKHQEAKARVDEMRNSLDAETGAITENTRALVAKRLEEEGALKIAAQAGISASVLTDAVLGQRDAWDATFESMSALTPAQKRTSEIMGGMTGEMTEQQSAAWNLSRIVNDLSGTFDTAYESQQRIVGAAKETISVNGVAAGAWSKHTAAVLGMTAAERGVQPVIQGTRLELEKQASATQDVYNKTLKLNGLLDDTASWVAYQQAVDDARKAMNKMDLGLAFTRGKLDVTKQAGRDLFTQLQGLVTAANSVKNASKRMQALEGARDIIRRTGIAAGLSGGALRDFVNQFIKVDRKAEESRRIMENLKEEMDRLGGTKVNVSFSADGLTAIISNVDRARGAIQDLVASQGQVQVQTRGSITEDFQPKRRHGGPVWAGQKFTVGEVGPELLIKGGGKMEIVGAHGQESRSFDGPGMILPTEQLARIERKVAHARAGKTAVAVPSPVRAGAGGRGRGPSAPEPPVHFHITAQDAFDVKQTVREAYADIVRDREERRINNDASWED